VLAELLKNVGRARVLVVGDSMLDRYWGGSVDRISPEAPVPVVSVKSEDERLGGAANVARNVRALGARCTLLTVTGDDVAADTIERLLRAENIDSTLQRDASMKTTMKLRIIAQKQQVVRLDFESVPSVNQKAKLLERFKEVVADHDVVIISDYNKGGLSHIDEMIKTARSLAVPVVVDPKGQNYRQYAGATLVTPNRKEFELVAGVFIDNDDLVRRARTLMRDNLLETLLITLGEEGMSLISLDQEPYHLSARKREVFDVTGAGDTVVSALGCALAIGGPLKEAVQLANIAAGIVVDRLGAATASVDEILEEIGNNRSTG